MKNIVYSEKEGESTVNLSVPDDQKIKQHLEEIIVCMDRLKAAIVTDLTITYGDKH